MFKKILEKFNMDKSYPTKTSMVVRSLDIEKDPFRPRGEKEDILGPQVPYLSAIGALMYLANSTRPDIAFAVNLLARHSAAPTKRHWYVLKPAQRITFCKYLRGVKFLDGFAANLGSYITANGSNVQGRMKTHSCHVLLQRIIPTCLRGLVHPDIYEAVAELGNFFRELCSRNLSLHVIECLKQEIPLILCKLEKIFPPAFFDVMVHLAVHLPEEALLRGPVQYGWMYPIEWQLGTLKNLLRNRARPEGSIARAYIESEVLTFCSLYMDDCVDGLPEFDGPTDGDTDIFMHGVRLIGRDRVQ